MTRYAAPLLGLLALLGLPGHAAAIDSPVLYLKRLPATLVANTGARSDLNLSECTTNRTEERTLGPIHVRIEREEAFPPFFTLPSPSEFVLPTGNATAFLILTTGADGTMNDCAGVTVDLYRETADGRLPLASGSVTTTLVPPSAGGSSTFVQVPISVGGSEAARTFAKGEILTAVILVKNTCGDSARNITLRYDSIDRLSRIVFDQIPQPVEGGPADPDGDGFVSICDNCPEDANPDQADHNEDGQGDVCTPCTPEGPKPPSCNCAIAQCEDGDPCTLDACDPEKGCVRDPLLSLAAVMCRLDVSEDAILSAQPSDLAPKLARRRGPLRRLIRKDRKLAVKAQRAIDKSKPEKKIGKKVTKVRRTLGKLIDKVEKLPGGISTDLQGFLLDQLNQGEDAIRTAP